MTEGDDAYTSAVTRDVREGGEGVVEEGKGEGEKLTSTRDPKAFPRRESQARTWTR